VRDGDLLRLDCHAGVLEARVPEEEWQSRQAAVSSSVRSEFGTGRELFAGFRRNAGDAEAGAMSLL
jgi:phosphogluconate dehydratase